MRWSTVGCDERLPFVCERRPWRVRAATGHGYRVLHGRYSWERARQACGRFGAHLATITDPDEQAYVGALVSRYAWVGGHDRDTEGTWVWITSEPWSYAAFAAGQPNDRADGGRAQDCLAVGPNQRWHDWDCEAEEYAAVCEID